MLVVAVEEKTVGDASNWHGKREIVKNPAGIVRIVRALLASLMFRAHHAGIVAYLELDLPHSPDLNTGTLTGCLIHLRPVSLLMVAMECRTLDQMIGREEVLGIELKKLYRSLECPMRTYGHGS